jgi:hypothetical protein
MLNLEEANPSAKRTLEQIETFENYCRGEKYLSPEKFREINNDLSIGAIFLIGKRRTVIQNNNRHLLWKGPDNHEHDLGRIDDVHVMRDYPGFHASRTNALGGDQVQESRVVENPKSKGTLCEVVMKDGSTGIGPNYRMALRNAALKMHIKKKFNFQSFADLWNGNWGYA